MQKGLPHAREQTLSDCVIMNHEMAEGSRRRPGGAGEVKEVPGKNAGVSQLVVLSRKLCHKQAE